MLTKPAEAEVIRRVEEVLGGGVRTLRFLGAGDWTWAWLVDGEWVARFARHAEAEMALCREAAVLPWLTQHLTFAIPQPMFHPSPDPSSLGFVTYPLVAGKPLTHRRFGFMSPTQREGCVREVAGFLNALHAVPTQWPAAQGVPRFEPRTRYEALLGQAEPLLLPQVTGELARFLVQLFRAYLDDATFAAPTVVLLHGDFGPPHILTRTARSARVTGVIDFGDMQLGPPAWDLVYLYEDLGPEFMQAFLPHFRTPQGEDLLREMYYFYQFDMVAWAVREIMQRGIGQAKGVIALLEALRVEASAEPWRALL